MENLILFIGIIEVSLDRPEAKNAIGKEMLRGLSHVFELINQNSSANVAMICSSVPGVFSAGADLKVIHQFLFCLFLDRKEITWVLQCILFFYSDWDHSKMN